MGLAILSSQRVSPWVWLLCLSHSVSSLIWLSFCHNGSSFGFGHPFQPKGTLVNGQGRSLGMTKGEICVRQRGTLVNSQSGTMAIGEGSFLGFGCRFHHNRSLLVFSHHFCHKESPPWVLLSFRHKGSPFWVWPSFLSQRVPPWV